MAKHMCHKQMSEHMSKGTCKTGNLFTDGPTSLKSGYETAHPKVSKQIFQKKNSLIQYFCKYK